MHCHSERDLEPTTPNPTATPAVQLRNTATRLSVATPERTPAANDVRKQPSPTALSAVRDEETVGSNPVIRLLVRRVDARPRRRMLLTWLCPGFGTAGTPSAPCPTSFGGAISQVSGHSRTYAREWPRPRRRPADTAGVVIADRRVDLESVLLARTRGTWNTRHLDRWMTN